MTFPRDTFKKHSDSNTSNNNNNNNNQQQWQQQQHQQLQQQQHQQWWQWQQLIKKTLRTNTSNKKNINIGDNSSSSNKSINFELGIFSTKTWRQTLRCFHRLSFNWSVENVLSDTFSCFPSKQTNNSERLIPGTAAQQTKHMLKTSLKWKTRLIIDVAEVNQWRWLEDSRQWLDNVDQTHLVLASGKQVLQKTISKNWVWTCVGMLSKRLP